MHRRPFDTFDDDFDLDATDGDFELDGDFDLERDVDGDFDLDDDYPSPTPLARSLSRDSRGRERGTAAVRERGYGVGRERDDAWEAGGMPMTRRDIDALYRGTLRDTHRFLQRRRDADANGRSEKSAPLELAVTGVEVVGGAMAAAYLAQRFKLAGALVPVGVTTGLLLLLAAHYNAFHGAEAHAQRIAIGLLAGAGGIWAAGQGALSAEGRDQPAATGGTLAAIAARVQQTPTPLAPAAAPTVETARLNVMPGGLPAEAPLSLADLQQLVAMRRAA